MTPARGRWATAAPGKFAGRTAVPGGTEMIFIAMRTNWRLMELLMELCSKGR